MANSCGSILKLEIPGNELDPGTQPDLRRAARIDGDRGHVEVQAVEHVRAATAVERDAPAVTLVGLAGDVPDDADDRPAAEIPRLVGQADLGGEDAVLVRIDVVQRAADVAVQRVDHRLGELRAERRVREVSERARPEERRDVAERRTRFSFGARDRRDARARQVDRVIDVAGTRHVPGVVEVRRREIVRAALVGRGRHVERRRRVDLVEAGRIREATASGGLNRDVVVPRGQRAGIERVGAARNTERDGAKRPVARVLIVVEVNVDRPRTVPGDVPE